VPRPKNGDNPLKDPKPQLTMMEGVTETSRQICEGPNHIVPRFANELRRISQQNRPNMNPKIQKSRLHAKIPKGSPHKPNFFFFFNRITTTCKATKLLLLFSK
jgi:hypothetical protein